MRRSILIFGMLLTLTAGVCGGLSVVAFACCAEEAGALAGSDEHDCCRAGVGHDDSASHPESYTTVRDSAGRGGAALGRDDSSCGECCAGGSGGAPATVLVAASDGNKTRRDARYISAETSRGLFAHASARVSQLAARPHAPPPMPARLHVLHSLFLI